MVARILATGVVVATFLMFGGCGGDRDTDGATARSLDLTRDLPGEYKRICAEQTSYAPTGARDCPPVIPGGRLAVEFAGPFSSQRRFKDGFSASFASRSVSAIGGKPVQAAGGHWSYAVAWSPRVRELMVTVGVQRPQEFAPRSACNGTRLREERVMTCRVAPYGEGGGFHGDHVVYVWDHDTVTYLISMHGYDNDPRARAMMSALIADVLG